MAKRVARIVEKVDRVPIESIGRNLDESLTRLSEALVVLGMANSRMKDYFDLFNLIGEAQMHAGTLASAIAATFARRGTPIPADLPLGLTETFALDALKQGQWHAFLSRNRLQAPGLEEVVKEIARTVGPLWSGAASR